MNRLRELEGRRAALLERSAAQRRELAARLGRLHGGAPARAGAEGPPEPGLSAGPARHPLAWIVVLAGLMLFGPKRDVISLLTRASTALTILSRTARVLRIVRDLRRGSSAESTAPARGPAH